MTRCAIIVSEVAEADIDSIADRLFLRSSDAAARSHDGIDEAIDSLREMPGRCAVAPDNKRPEYPMRQLLYRQGGTTYRVLRVRRGGQPPLDSSPDPDAPDEG